MKARRQLYLKDAKGYIRALHSAVYFTALHYVAFSHLSLDVQSIFPCASVGVLAWRESVVPPIILESWGRVFQGGRCGLVPSVLRLWLRLPEPGRGQRVLLFSSSVAESFSSVCPLRSCLYWREDDFGLLGRGRLGIRLPGRGHTFLPGRRQRRSGHRRSRDNHRRVRLRSSILNRACRLSPD